MFAVLGRLDATCFCKEACGDEYVALANCVRNGNLFSFIKTYSKRILQVCIAHTPVQSDGYLMLSGSVW